MLILQYRLEAEVPIMRGRVICGSRRGYDGTEKFSLTEVCDAIARLHKNLNERSRPTVPCIVSEGSLVGRTGENAYQEKVYFCDFSQSLRAERLETQIFRETVREYAHELGEEFNQTRMYIEFDGRVEVWKAEVTEE